MLGNYLTVAIRNILKYKVFSLINVLGLALALSVGLLIVLMLADQKEYDQFNQQKERIYRLLSDDANSPFPNATSPIPLAAELKNHYPIVEQATRLVRGVGGDAIYNRKTAEIRGFFSDPSFFEVFSFDLTKGDKRTALHEPNSMIITDKVAQTLFGSQNPIGKTVRYFDRGLHYLGGNRKEVAPTEWGHYTITGVIASQNYN
ncbi:ABC transporter permease [Spirosoma endbachense]|uniref:MacB-like periplasmic core domain-containing protein n=1 Tax=Spirosoma endbachense TaxID=2666025 RepID=A0A6P1W4B8_9BACT|nr:ABC transporter permease [Spirosoma endbachense]QHW00264.1 hypothetical protein GJR95_36895 [Spirosoma endbachense]